MAIRVCTVSSPWPLFQLFALVNTFPTPASFGGGCGRSAPIRGSAVGCDRPHSRLYQCIRTGSQDIKKKQTCNEAATRSDSSKGGSWTVVACCGTVVGGWLGRVSTILQVTLRCIPHSTSASLLFACFFFAFSIHGSFVSSWSPTWNLCRRCICEPSMDKTVKECVKADVADSYSGKLVVRACRSRAHSLARWESGRGREHHDSTGKLTACWETLQSNVTLLPGLSSKMVFAAR